MDTKRLYVDFHVLQTVPPSCVNRDDTGSPKTAVYGGATRARVSSQAWKHAIRKMFAEEMADMVETGKRTLKATDLVAGELAALAPELDDARLKKDAKKALENAGIKLKDDNNAALLFLSTAQARALARLAARTDVVCFGSLAQRSAASHATVVRFLDGVIRRERPTLRVFDVNLRQDFFSREVLEESMARCNILKISDEEAPRVAGCLTGCPAADPGGLCRELLDRRENLEMVILTEGAEGSRVFTRNRISAYVIPRGERVRPVDTVGAGDSFTAAFCAMLAAGYDIWPAQAFASKVAAFVCSCAGATPEYPAAAKTEFSGNL